MNRCFTHHPTSTVIINTWPTLFTFSTTHPSTHPRLFQSKSQSSHALNFKLLHVLFLKFHLHLLLICSFWALSYFLLNLLFSFMTPDIKYTYFFPLFNSPFLLFSLFLPSSFLSSFL